MLLMLLVLARRRLKRLVDFRRFPPQEERQFERFYADRAYARAQFGVLFGFFAWCSFFAWDWLGFPNLLPQLAAIRLGLVAPLIGGLAWFIACYPERFKHRMQAWLAAAPTAAGLGLYLMMSIAQQEDANEAFQQFWPAFSCLYFFLYLFLGLRLLPAALVGLFSFMLVWKAGLRQGVEVHAMGAALLQLAILNFLGMVLCIRMELQERTLFRLRQHHLRLAQTAWKERRIAQDARDEALLENARAEAALMLAREERKKLASSIAEKESFLSAAYHDLQQPLSAIGLYVRSAKIKLRHNVYSAIETDLETIENAGQDIASMFKGVRDSWELGWVQPQLEAVDLNAMLEEIERELKDSAERKKLMFRFRRPQPAWVLSDRKLLKRAISNLVGNAIKYTQEGGVLVGAVALKSNVRIDVLDSGVGIPEEFKGRIFEEYFQVGNPQGDRRRGLGLGLAIVSRIEKSLPGHRLRFASRLNEGSRFTLYAPIAAAPHPRFSLYQPKQQADGMACGLLGKYVVVVEDDPSNLQGLLRLIEDAGCIAEGAEGVEQACRLFSERERCPDVLVTDFRLRQGETGLDAVAALRRRFEWAASIPVLFVTGELEAASRLSGFQGIHAIHRKPVDADVFLNQLRDLATPALE